MTRHALLSPSSAHRWIKCTPSAVLEEKFENTTSTAAEEGTAAHAWCEYKLNKLLNRPCEKPSTEYDSNEMQEYSDAYVDFVMEKYEQAKLNCQDPILLIEQKVDFSAYVPDGFGTADCIIVGEKTLQVIDFKYGQGVLVDAYENPQMKCYALGALTLFDSLYEIQSVEMSIFQPRRDNVSTFTLPVTELISWAESVLKPKAELAIKGEGEFEAGDWCRFCRAKATCRKRAEENLKLAELEFKPPSLLTDSEIEEVLKTMNMYTRDIEQLLNKAGGIIMNNLFSLLRNKDIIDILDGDTKYGDYEYEDFTTIKISMPYLSGPDLCGLSNSFGLPATYPRNGGALSRWNYLDNLLEYCIKNNKCPSLLAYMFSLNQFSKQLNGHSANEIKKTHKKIVSTILEKINELLFFGGNKLIVNGENFEIRPIESHIEIAAPTIKIIDRDYIKSISSRAMRAIEQNDFDSAITKARTLLEETFCYVIEKKNEIPSDSGDIGKLYKQVRTLYNMHTDANTDRRINTLLSGLSSIVSAIAEMRNKDSDAHGVGAKRIPIKEHHTRLFVNAAMSMADFILSVEQKCK